MYELQEYHKSLLNKHKKTMKIRTRLLSLSSSLPCQNSTPATSATTINPHILPISFSTMFFIVVSSFLVLVSNPQYAYAHHIVDEIDVKSRPMRLCICERGLLYVSNLGDPGVTIINTTNDNLAGQLPLTQTQQRGVMTVEATPQKVYVAPLLGGALQVYDSITRGYIKSIPLPHAEIAFRQPLADRLPLQVTVVTGGWSMDYNPNNQMLYVANYNANEIVIIDTKTDTVAGAIPVSPHPITVKVDPSMNTLLVASLAGNQLTFISTETNNITKTLRTGPTGPWGLDIDTARHLAYVTNRGSHYITVVDTKNQEIVTTIPIGAPAQAIAVDEAEQMIYASYMEQDRILKIDGRTNNILTIIDMNGIIPQDMVVDSTETHKVFVSTKFANKIFVVGPHSLSFELPIITRETPTGLIGFIQAHSQDVQVFDPYLNVFKKSIDMDLLAEDGGELNLMIPRNILDSKQANGTDFRYIVEIDGTQVEPQETTIEEGDQLGAVGNNSRGISIFVPPGSTSLEVFGTKAL
jgi:YVTN family beta-propeller protein